MKPTSSVQELLILSTEKSGEVSTSRLSQSTNLLHAINKRTRNHGSCFIVNSSECLACILSLVGVHSVFHCVLQCLVWSSVFITCGVLMIISFCISTKNKLYLRRWALYNKLDIIVLILEFLYIFIYYISGFILVKIKLKLKFEP